MKALSIAWFNLKRMVRERSNIFFVFIFPIALVLLIGVQFGGGFSPVVGVQQADAGQISNEIAATLSDSESIDIREFETEDALVSAVERGTVQAGALLPAGMDHASGVGEHGRAGAAPARRTDAHRRL